MRTLACSLLLGSFLLLAACSEPPDRASETAEAVAADTEANADAAMEAATGDAVADGAEATAGAAEEVVNEALEIEAQPDDGDPAE